MTHQCQKIPNFSCCLNNKSLTQDTVTGLRSTAWEPQISHAGLRLYIHHLAVSAPLPRTAQPSGDCAPIMNITFSGREGLHVFLRHSYIYRVLLFRICELFQVVKYWVFSQIQKWFYSRVQCLLPQCWLPSNPPSWGWAQAVMTNETKCPQPATQLINPSSSSESSGWPHQFCPCHGHDGHREMVPPAQRRVSPPQLVSREPQTETSSDPL